MSGLVEEMATWLRLVLPYEIEESDAAELLNHMSAEFRNRWPQATRDQFVRAWELAEPWRIADASISCGERAS